MALDHGVLVQDKLHGALAVTLIHFHRERLAARFDVGHFAGNGLFALL